MEQHGKERLEQDLANALTEGEMAGKDPDVAALRRLSPRYEIRTQTTHDPIVEETKLVRSMAREIDDRYDRYMSRADKSEEHKE
ncbi:hypothetical protein [Paenibacillus ginsengarvi]|uniref:Uncharacterized protein n=1 Tax=Paenibacillus ginsengarvi TaxID=400777 RepID=A0A3B0CAD7_9BACL|nr:hypothetical protein [Paenibacillus ginsengarvi]RKN82130.1 hypothetical protein D7M11_17385 [Paenibacillus ginsengarvi]